MLRQNKHFAYHMPNKSFFIIVPDHMSVRFTVSLLLKNRNVPIRSFCKGTPKMAENIYTGVLLSTILEGLEKFAPLKLAESWDNVGLLVDPMQAAPIRRILLTNDLTESVVNEAILQRVGLIITYHPSIFQGLKSVTARWVISGHCSKTDL